MKTMNEDVSELMLALFVLVSISHFIFLLQIRANSDSFEFTLMKTHLSLFGKKLSNDNSNISESNE